MGLLAPIPRMVAQSVHGPGNMWGSGTPIHRVIEVLRSSLPTMKVRLIAQYFLITPTTMPCTATFDASSKMGSIASFAG